MLVRVLSVQPSLPDGESRFRLGRFALADSQRRGQPVPMLRTGSTFLLAFVNWIRSRARVDSLYGIVFLPAGITLGDTLALFLRRRQ